MSIELNTGAVRFRDADGNEFDFNALGMGGGSGGEGGSAVTDDHINDLIDDKLTDVVHKSGDESIAGVKTFTGKIAANAIETGTDDAAYFQSRKFRGEGNASSYYHAIDFGYAQHDQVDFYEYGGLWQFWKNTAATKGGTLMGAITPNGIKEGDTLLKNKYQQKLKAGTGVSIAEDGTISVTGGGGGSGGSAFDSQIYGEITKLFDYTEEAEDTIHVNTGILLSTLRQYKEIRILLKNKVNSSLGWWWVTFHTGGQNNCFRGNGASNLYVLRWLNAEGTYADVKCNSGNPSVVGLNNDGSYITNAYDIGGTVMNGYKINYDGQNPLAFNCAVNNPLPVGATIKVFGVM